MRRAELDALAPGEVLRPVRGRGKLRVFVSGGKVVELVKVGRSWTDPNPGAYYDPAYVAASYERTGKRSPKTLARFLREMATFRRRGARRSRP